MDGLESMDVTSDSEVGSGLGMRLGVGNDEVVGDADGKEDGDVGSSGVDGKVEGDVGSSGVDGAIDDSSREEKVDHTDAKDADHGQARNSSTDKASMEDDATPDEVKDNNSGDGQSGGDGKSKAARTRDETKSQEGEENDLPVLRNEEDDNAKERGIEDTKALRSEIPDSEADTDEAVSPVKSDIGGKMKIVDADEVDVEDDTALTTRTLKNENENENETPVTDMGVEISIMPNDQMTGTPANEHHDGGDVAEVTASGTEVECMTSLNDNTSLTQADEHQNQDIETGVASTSMEIDSSDQLMNQAPQDPDKEMPPTNPVHQDSSAVSFVDDQDMVIFPRITTSDLQPTHTPTQTQTQEEVVDSHFADAVAVMSDAGGGSQDAMSSIDEVGGEALLEQGALQPPGHAGVETESFGDGEAAGEVLTMIGDETKAEELPELKFREEPQADGPNETAVEPVSSFEQVVIEGADETGLTPATEAERIDLKAPDVEATDTVMCDESLQHPNNKSQEHDDFPSKEVEIEDVEMASTIPDVTAMRPTTARSIPDSDDDGGLPDAEPIPDAEKQVNNRPTAPNVFQPTIETSGANENDAQLPRPSLSPHETTTSKTPLQPKTPNMSFKAPSFSTATESQSSEQASSPAKPEIAMISPSKAAKAREKTPEKVSKASDGVQNKDILMAELKAIKIASIQARNASLQAEIQKKKARLEEVTKELNYPAAETVKNHIKLLHDYNDIRDVGQGLVGMIADNRGVRIGELYDEFGVGLKD